MICSPTAFCKKIFRPNHFNTVLVEGDGTCLFSPCADKNWLRIRQSGNNIFDKYRGRIDLSKLESISSDVFFQTSASREFPAAQDIRLVFIEKCDDQANRKKLIYRLLTVSASVACSAFLPVFIFQACRFVCS
ncbi:MAG: hypothetical protein M0O96_01820 [Desulforhopalus sp.]|nr:hypothetical protein [Desulforhopalus sp.]